MSTLVTQSYEMRGIREDGILEVLAPPIVQAELKENIAPRLHLEREVKVFDNGASYTILQHPSQYSGAIRKAMNFILVAYKGIPAIQLVGIGTSGAIMMALMQHYAINSRYPIEFRPIQLRKDKEDTHRPWIAGDFNPIPTFFVDDHISSGDTMFTASKMLSTMMTNEGPYISFVEGVFAHEAHTRGNADSLFPNLKYILY